MPITIRRYRRSNRILLMADAAVHEHCKQVLAEPWQRFLLDAPQVKPNQVFFIALQHWLARLLSSAKCQ